MSRGTSFRRFIALALCAAFVSPTTSLFPRVSCSTTKGTIIIEIYEDWAPLGAEHFLTLIRDGFFTDIALYRSVPGFLTQFGISDNPQMKHWHHKTIKDDPNLHKGIRKHYISYAGGGPNTRSTQLFIAYEDLPFLGKELWEVPFGRVIEGSRVLDDIYKDYGDIHPFGPGPDQVKLHQLGNRYIRENFPLTDFIVSCEVVEDKPEPTNAKIQPFPATLHASNSNLRNQTHISDKTVSINHQEEVASMFPAIVAVLLLLVAVFLLWCLYQYNASPEGAKSN